MLVEVKSGGGADPRAARAGCSYINDNPLRQHGRRPARRGHYRRGVGDSASADTLAQEVHRRTRLPEEARETSASHTLEDCGLLKLARWHGGSYCVGDCFRRLPRTDVPASSTTRRVAGLRLPRGVPTRPRPLALRSPAPRQRHLRLRGFADARVLPGREFNDWNQRSLFAREGEEGLPCESCRREPTIHSSWTELASTEQPRSVPDRAARESLRGE